MKIDTIRTEGLGDSTYVLSHGGVALVVDPQRDIDRFEAAIEATGAEPRYVLETHLHNDYISGGRELAAKTGAELVLPSGAAPVFRHSPAFHMEELNGGPLSIRPLHTPGHTPEHMSYAVVIEGEIRAVFSGGSLLVGSAGRTDLLGSERAETLARLQYGSVNRLAALPEEAGLYPTHGSGSFCTASGTGSPTSTIGEEKRTNPVLAYDDEDSFVFGQLSGLVPYPDYYRHMGPANLMGAPPPPPFDTAEIDEDALAELGSEVQIVDIRPQERFASGHIPGSIGVELQDNFGVWVGWVLPFNAPLVLVADPDQDLREARRQLSRIGFDDVRGVVWGLDGWSSPLSSYETVSVEGFATAARGAAQIVDVRAPDEWEEGVIAGSILRYAPDIASGSTEDIDDEEPVWVACGSGYRATIAASYLEAEGHTPMVLANRGVGDVLEQLSKDQA